MTHNPQQLQEKCYVATNVLRCLGAEKIIFFFFYRKEKHIYQLRVRMGNNYWKFLEKGKRRKGQLEQTMTR